MKMIAFTKTQADGIPGVSIMTPFISTDDPAGFTQDMALERSLAKDLPKDATDAIVITSDELPPTDEFRFAWTIVGDKIALDAVKCKDILVARSKDKMLALHKQMQEAVAIGDDASDLQAQLDSAQKSHAALKAFEVTPGVAEPAHLEKMKAAMSGDDQVAVAKAVAVEG